MEACASIAELYFYGQFDGIANYEKAFYWAEKEMCKSSKREDHVGRPSREALKRLGISLKR